MADNDDVVIRAMDEKIAALRLRVKRDTADMETLERARAVMARGQSLTTVGSPPIPGLSGYAGLKPQAGVERFLRENPGVKYKAGEVARRLVALGFEGGGKNFTSTIIGAMNRAVKKGIALRETGANGRNVYSLKTGETA